MKSNLSAPIKLLTRSAGDVRIHSFVASYTGNNIADATHIVESKNQLVLIDGQFLAPYARQFREYADALKKPIERLYLTHRHPDHWFGIGAAFSDVQVYSLPETQVFIQEHGEASRRDHVAKLGDLAPPQVVVPQHVARLGAEKIDGVQYVFSKVVDTEIDFHLIVHLPDLRVAIVQDLIYSGTHLYLTKDLDRWLDVLGDFLQSEYDLFLAGHGLPADKTEVARNVQYLAAAKQAIADGLKDEAFKVFMLKAFPERKCPGIFDIYMPRLFDGAREY